jgi:hypothetical protein
MNSRNQRKSGGGGGIGHQADGDENEVKALI